MKLQLNGKETRTCYNAAHDLQGHPFPSPNESNFNFFILVIQINFPSQS